MLALVHREKSQLAESGGKKLYHLLKDELKLFGIKLGRDKFLKVLKKNGLLKVRKKFKMPKTDSNHPFKMHKNLIADLLIEYADQVWVSDITYIRVLDKWHYLTLITDVYSRKIVGYSFSSDMTVNNTTRAAIDMAVKNRKNVTKTILHSDRGIQYCNPNFVDKIKRKGISSSMGAKGNPYDNAIAERINGILKYEFGLKFKFANSNIASDEIDKAIKLYNNKRPHWSLNLKTPQQVYDSSSKSIQNLVP